MIQIPQTGTFIELDPVIGWQAAWDHLSPVNPSGLAVDCVPGRPKPFVASLASQLRYPIALALGDRNRSLYLLDDEVNRVKALDLQRQKEFVTIAGFGGKGKQARRFRNPRGLAVLEDGSYVIADTGNHQVKIFSSFPNALLAVWGSGSPGARLENSVRRGRWLPTVVVSSTSQIAAMDGYSVSVATAARKSRLEACRVLQAWHLDQMAH